MMLNKVKEVPGGKVDEPDVTLLHAAARELKEETGLTAKKVVRKVTEMEWTEFGGKRGRKTDWLKHIFEIEVEGLEDLALAETEHQSFLWATEEEVLQDKVGEVQLTYITPPNKDIKLEAFRKNRNVEPRAN
ncbi:hypothetical protein K505DRAFT_329721 [Melanomma pulvis-pyrius CBS 109.77]|uniref:Nudix hydrolase domain-containing protein n=1 Tax=Melanomma pulvis-pyrius CBS 109.77 TaxID=1314802 RepID=A0A6A6WTJ8_9PLEO|nr:hypothetical protein K505DRAFT_329721 [Melanomma pulvis-pyrius CBS 109.77]